MYSIFLYVWFLNDRVIESLENLNGIMTPDTFTLCQKKI